MSTYRKVDANLNFVEREKKIEQFWKDHSIFKKSIDTKADGPVYTFYDGPPTANGKPHIGHVLTRVIKDMIPRYHTMKGAKIIRKAGWDTHGLPVELEVEKKLGINGKDQIEGYGLEPFIKECKESVWKYKGMWEDFSSTVGFWADMDDPYITYDNKFIESEWWALKQIWDKGLLYKGHKIVPYCPRCGTPLSSHEVAQGYKDVKERSATAKFAVVGEENTYFLAWTTTPWTLPSNVALCVNPVETYVKVKVNDEYFILAEALVESNFKDVEVEVVETYVGTDLERKEYKALFEQADLVGKAYYVTCDNYVTLTDGTGIVHIAPAFGEDDSKVGNAYGLPFLQLVDGQGCLTEGTKWPGTFCKDADKLVLQDLDERGLLFNAPKFEHSYPFCWRCDTPLIYYARDTWFIKMTAVKEDMIRNNKTINWIPKTIGEGRFGSWLENIQDWGISRNRYWGTPLNVWECSCGKRHVIGSIAELKEMSDNCPDEIELHRPYVDAVTIKCPDCGGEMHRVPEVIDCWFDSGAMPFAQWHYPFENKDIFEENFPADFISEAVDQTRGWFYSLLAESTILFNKAPYKNVIVLGLVQDENGQKMSKSKGNAVDPFDALATHGADAIRWYFYSNSAPWLPNRFYDKAVTEGQRKFMGTLWNTYAFFVLYANIDSFDASQYKLEYDKLSVMDKWMLSRVNSAVKAVDENLANYKITETTKILDKLVDDMSNWYVRLSRQRFWVKGMPQDKINAYMTLYTSLVMLCKAAAPMIPFMTEDIYLNLVKSIDADAPESIHLCDFPEADEAFIDKELEESMAEVLDIVVLGRACRNTSGLKSRQPLNAIYVKAETELKEFYKDIIKTELNIKNVEFVDDVSQFASYSFKPQLRTLGRRFGKNINAVREILANIDGAKAMAEINEKGTLTIEVDGNDEALTPEDLLIETVKSDDYVTDQEGSITVVLETKLNDELIEEGFVREIVSKLQNMRKDSGFEVMDHIRIYLSGNAKISGIFTRNGEYIKTQVLSDEIMFDEDCVNSKEWNINGEKVNLGVEKV
ncbi:MAG: isoleucine--tRNA ligase [Oscillospiraceae bacterium]|nr:isoleucine--tRNA ligase [Oscillospiraceae bacterium]